MEEVTGRNYRPERKMITFFGYAKTLKTRYPFLFGELRLPVTSEKLMALSTQRLGNWEGAIEKEDMISFTVDGVTAWISEHRNTPAIGTTLFSLFQSLIYQYPEDIGRICKKLDKGKYRERVDLEETMLKIYSLLVLPLGYSSGKEVQKSLKSISNKEIAKSLGWRDASQLSRAPYYEFIKLCRKLSDETNSEERKKLKTKLQEFLPNPQEKHEERISYGSNIIDGSADKDALLGSVDSETRTVLSQGGKHKPN